MQRKRSVHSFNMKEARESIEKYIENMEQISVLSSPKLKGNVKVLDYTMRLRENFIMIGKLAAQNRGILDACLFPVLNKTSLTESERQILGEAVSALLDGYSMENVDIPLAVMISNKLLMDAQNRGSSEEELIQTLDENVLTNYSLMNMAKRTGKYSSLCENCRNRAFSSARMLLEYLEPQRYAKLDSVEAKGMVLTNARYISALYENLSGDDKINRENMEILQNAERIGQEDFYQRNTPGFDWNYYYIRLYEYFGMTLEQHNRRGFHQKQCRIVSQKCDRLKELWEKNPKQNAGITTEAEVKLLCLRAEYLSGKISSEEYRFLLFELYNDRNIYGYSMGDVYLNVLLPVEYMCLLDNCKISEEEKRTLEEFYHNAVNYVFRMPNQASLNFLLEYFCALLDCFIEVPGGMTLLELGLSCLAAFHAPTYVHTMMVGKLTACLCGHLLTLHPEAFSGVLGYDGKEPLTEEKRYEIIEFAYQGALCHDFGKLYVMDTISVYGRKILDDEFDMIQCHGDLGSDLLLRCESTRRYANIAKGHHKWYDNTKGYPQNFDTSTVPEKILIDLVTIADCLDAATDTVGRSFSKGKSLADIKAELTEGAGTRYTPYIVELMEHPQVDEDLKFILSEYRLKQYRETYVRLQKVSERERH